MKLKLKPILMPTRDTSPVKNFSFLLEKSFHDTNGFYEEQKFGKRRLSPLKAKQEQQRVQLIIQQEEEKQKVLQTEMGFRKVIATSQFVVIIVFKPFKFTYVNRKLVLNLKQTKNLCGCGSLKEIEDLIQTIYCEFDILEFTIPDRKASSSYELPLYQNFKAEFGTIEAYYPSLEVYWPAFACKQFILLSNQQVRDLITNRNFQYYVDRLDFQSLREQSRMSADKRKDHSGRDILAEENAIIIKFNGKYLIDTNKLVYKQIIKFDQSLQLVLFEPHSIKFDFQGQVYDRRLSLQEFIKLCCLVQLQSMDAFIQYYILIDEERQKAEIKFNVMTSKIVHLTQEVFTNGLLGKKMREIPGICRLLVFPPRFYLYDQKIKKTQDLELTLDLLNTILQCKFQGRFELI